MNDATKVVFRKFRDNGEVIALFPEIPHDAYGRYCVSYMHVGQHGAADTGLVYGTDLATPEEYASLKEELENIGYNLEVRKKITRQMDDARHARAKEYRDV